jgi:holo-[acyl-carrier protein] synthase
VIIGVGIDVVDVDAVESLERTPGLAERVFTETERHVGPASLAARFREGGGSQGAGAPGGLRLRLRDPDRGFRPARAGLQGTVADRAAELGIRSWHVSLSHDAGIASAVVIAELRSWRL